jgi:hypothetical protein
MGRLRERLRRAATSPLFWVLLGVLALRLVGLGWGLPASDGWDNDGVAPRDFLSGLVETFTPGKFFTYPPVHLVLLGLVTSPITGVALAKAPSLAPAEVIGEILKVPYMTAAALVARAISAVMSVGIVWAMAKIAEELRGRRAGLAVAIVCGLNAPLTYYAHTTNLDVPYLFWASLALLALVRTLARREPRRLRHVAVLAALAIGTKDQAYATIGLAAPLALVAWLAMDPWPRKNLRAVLTNALAAALLFAALLLVTLAIVFNPTGFRARLAFLVGSASQDFAHYSTDAKGLALVVADSLLRFERYYPWVLGVAVVLGLVVAVRSGRENLRAAALVPLLGALSFTVLFNCTARRTEHRFLLPQMVFWSVYAGIFLEVLVFQLRSRTQRRLGAAIAGVLFGWALFKCADVDANLVLDPRYEAEAWLNEHAAAGDVIEVHGLNVYLPRFPAQARVIRVGHEPVNRRNPLPGVLEVQGDYGDAERRDARFLVVSEGWVWRYLIDLDEWTAQSGKVLPKTQLQNSTEADGTTFFQGLVKGRRGFTRVHESKWTSTLWPRLDIHASTAREIWIFERRR